MNLGSNVGHYKENGKTRIKVLVKKIKTFET
jgi:hypothetical protein